MSQPSPDPTYVIGVDYGTLSGRAVVVRVHDGAEMGSAVHEYAHGVMDTVLATTGEALPPEWALQVPARACDHWPTMPPVFGQPCWPISNPPFRTRLVVH